jgi:hypothetical protein
MEQESVARLMKAEMDAKKDVDDAKKGEPLLRWPTARVRETATAPAGARPAGPGVAPSFPRCPACREGTGQRAGPSAPRSCACSYAARSLERRSASRTLAGTGTAGLSSARCVCLQSATRCSRLPMTRLSP